MLVCFSTAKKNKRNVYRVPVRVIDLHVCYRLLFNLTIDTVEKLLVSECIRVTPAMTLACRLVHNLGPD